MAGAKEVVVTFLFTDIEGSTTLFGAHPEAYPLAVATHHEILRTAIEAHGGRVFETVGDAAYAAFERPQGAIRAALDAQRALQSAAWGEIGEIRVRMGVHTGPADARDGRYYGPTVLRCERLASTAHGRQIVVSAATASAVGEHPLTGVGLRDMGVHRLRGLALPERIFQILDPTLPAEFPALRTLTTVLSKLPRGVGAFIDRMSEMVEIERALAGSRLVTIAGPAGIGKTRTALELAPTLLDGFPDGAWFVALDGVTTGAVADRIAEAAGMRARGQPPTVADVGTFLAPKQLLLLVDHCEAGLEECARVLDALLRSCRHLKVLSTSRELLGITGEVAVRLPPLSELHAQVLFLDRARQARADFRLADTDGGALAALCEDLDRAPGAIEQAARHVADAPIDQILAKLRAAATSYWGHERLSPSERLLLQRLSALDGTWTLEQAEQTGSGGQIRASDVLDLLAALVEKSLILTEAGDEGVRYRIPEALRRFGQQHLVESA